MVEIGQGHRRLADHSRHAADADYRGVRKGVGKIPDNNDGAVAVGIGSAANQERKGDLA